MSTRVMDTSNQLTAGEVIVLNQQLEESHSLLHGSTINWPVMASISAGHLLYLSKRLT